jgi:hypothetical protein
MSTQAPASEPLIRNLDQHGSSKTNLPFVVMVLGIAILAGVGSGFLLSRVIKPSANTNQTTTSTSDTSSSGKKVVGVVDKKTFKDSAEGILREGGIEGEGSYYLERPGGKSQNAYLTSSTVDLSAYIGKKVKVYGETQTAKKAGWLMDVGAVETE